MSGISYQSGSDALASLKTVNEKTTFNVYCYEVWGFKLGGYLFIN